MRTVSAVVHLASVPYGDDHDQQDVVLDGVDDAVVAHAYPQRRAALQRTGGGWPWVLCKKGDRSLDPTTGRWIDLAQRPHGGGSKLDAVVAQLKPRSALA